MVSLSIEVEQCESCRVQAYVDDKVRVAPEDGSWSVVGHVGVLRVELPTIMVRLQGVGVQMCDDLIRQLQSLCRDLKRAEANKAELL